MSTHWMISAVGDPFCRIRGRIAMCGTKPRTLVTSFDITHPEAMRQIDQASFESNAPIATGDATYSDGNEGYDDALVIGLVVVRRRRTRSP